ncbi:MAG TPA: CHASE3 domain-containing protein [Burkholderiales bacterium]|nr:CHASE3 domain-containing protein [Burkholderiales bacterium]
MAGAVFVTATILGLSELGHDETTEALEKITYVEQDSRSVLQFLGLMTDAETGHRGYLLKQSDDYVERYRGGVAGAKAVLQTMVQRYQKSGDTEGIIRISRIATIAGEKFSEMEMVFRHAAQGEMDKAMEVFNTDIGLNKMLALRSEVQELLEHTQSRANSLRQDAAAVSRYSRVSVAAVTAVNIVLLVFVFRRLGDSWREKEQEADRLRAQQEWLDGEVRARTVQLEDLSVHLQDVLEAEKVRLARELHDELGSILTAAKMDVAWVRRRLGKSPAEIDEKLERTLKNIDQGIMVKRQLIEDLRPSTLSSFGLIVAARELVEESAARNEWMSELDLPEAEPDIGPDTATAIYRILQETLTNASKYANAKRMSVRLKCSDQDLTLEIEDDGVGFLMRDIRPKALGLVGMRQRVQARGGSFEISSRPGAGCRVRVILPLKRNEQCVAAAESVVAPPTAPNA